MGALNPLRYRGYVYDYETGLYYLQSRYYSPKVGRFLNADALVTTGQGLLGNNMFAYCLNNPVMCSDEHGTATKSCLHDSTEPRDPWRNAGSGGGIPRKNYLLGGEYVTRTECTWFYTDVPVFFDLSNDGLTIVSWALSVYNQTYYFDESKEECIYVSWGNVELYAGAHLEDGFGAIASASVLDVGYSNKSEVCISFLCVGGGSIYKKETGWKPKVNAGLVGGSVSLSIADLIDLIFGG